MKRLLLSTVFAVFAVNSVSANNCYSFGNKNCSVIASEEGLSVPPPCSHSSNPCSEVYPGVLFCNTSFGFKVKNASIQRHSYPAASGTTRSAVESWNYIYCVQKQSCNGCDTNNICKGGNWGDYGSQYLKQVPHGDPCP